MARAHAAGLAAARTVLTHWASSRLPTNRLHGLVLIADAPGRPPKPLSDLAQLVAGGSPRAWLLPWLDPLRLVTDPKNPDPALVLPRPVRKFTEDLQALIAEATATPVRTS